jgi:hypothetical protein
MRKASAVALLWFVLAVALLSAAAAQPRPDFSGRWILIDPIEVGPEVATELLVEVSVNHKSVTGTPSHPGLVTLTVHRRSPAEVHSVTWLVGVVGGVVGGVDSFGRGSGPNGEVWRSGHPATWDNDALVLENSYYSGATRDSGPHTERREVWRLDEKQRLVITITERSSESPPKSVRLNYRRP